MDLETLVAASCQSPHPPTGPERLCVFEAFFGSLLAQTPLWMDRVDQSLGEALSLAL